MSEFLELGKGAIKKIPKYRDGVEMVKDLGIIEDNGKRVRKVIIKCTSCGDNRKVEYAGSKRKVPPFCFKCGRKSSANKLITHGMSKTRLQRIYNNMVQRCTNPKSSSYVRYGAKGVSVCEEWKNNPESFYTWSKNNGYSSSKEIDKDILCKSKNISPKIYSPDTCMWVSRELNSKHIDYRIGISGYRGTYKKRNRFYSRIKHEGKVHNLGSYDTAKEAANAYNNFIIKHNIDKETNDIK